MEIDHEIQQSNSLFIVNEYTEALHLVKSILPYYESNGNGQLRNELSAKLQSELADEKELLVKLENKLELQTKYYNAETNIYMIKYDDAIQGGVDEIIEKIKEKKLSFDSIFFTLTALGPKQIYGHDKFCQVVEKFSSEFEPQISTVVYQKPDDYEIDVDFIMKQEEELECFTESVHEDLKKLNESDGIVKPRAKSMLEETEGITRIIDILESNVWTGSEMIAQEKKSKESSNAAKLNIHLPTYEKNKDVREKYEKQLAEEQLKDKEQDTIQEKEQQNTKNEGDNKEKENQSVQQEKKEQVDSQDKLAQNQNVQKESQEQQASTKVEQLKEEVKAEETQKDIKKDNKADSTEKNQSKKQTSQKYDNNDEEDLQEGTMNDFLKILQQMKGVKESSSKLSDEQRKAQAEKMILGLMEQFGLDEGEDDDEDY